MARADSDDTIRALRNRIMEVQADLARLGAPVPEIPELIESANLRRSNLYLAEANEKRAALVLLYEQYSAALEDLLVSVFEIQNSLKDILKEQSLMIRSAPADTNKRSAKGSAKTAKPKARPGRKR